MAEFHSRLAASGPSVLDTLCGRDRAGEDSNLAAEGKDVVDADGTWRSLLESLTANLTVCCCCCTADCSTAISFGEPSATSDDAKFVRFVDLARFSDAAVWSAVDPADGA